MSEEAISLYFGLESGIGADMDVVGQCLMHLSAAIKDCSFFLNPGMAVRIEVVRERDGSLIIDFIVKSAKKVFGDKLTLAEITFVILFWLGTDLRQYGNSKIFDKFFTSSEAHSELDKDKLGDKLDKVEHSDVGGIHIRNFYGTLNADPGITGVGAARGHDQAPSIIVRRDEFRHRSHPSQHQNVERVRVRQEEMTATLVAPVLVSGTQKWRFRVGKDRFSAPILDGRFREKLLEGRTNVRLQAGIQMDIVVSILENKVNGLWVPVSREVIEVRSIRSTPHQAPFKFDD